MLVESMQVCLDKTERRNFAFRLAQTKGGSERKFKVRALVL